MASSPRYGVALPVQDGLTPADFVRLAQLAEREDFDTVFVGEIAGVEAFSIFGLILASTERVRIAPGIVAIYNRSPVLTGMGFATLAAFAPGRVVAGLGVGSHTVVERWNGRRLHAPLRTMEEFVGALRAVLSGEKVQVDGREVRVESFRLQQPAPGPVPILIGGFNPAMLRLAGRVADGVLLAWAPTEELPARIAAVREGAEEAGRDPDALEIATYVQGYAGPRVEEATDRFRRLVLEYSVLPTHRSAFVGSFPEIERATELWAAGERKQALALVPDETVQRLNPIGEDGTVFAARLEEARAAGITLPVAFAQGLDQGDAETPANTIRAVAAALRERVA